MKIKYTKEMLEPIIRSSLSFAQVLQKLPVAIKPAGGNYRTLKQAVLKLGLDTTHFTGQRWNKGRVLPVKVAIEEYLSNRKFCQSNKLRKRLIREGILEPRCSCCLSVDWLDKPIPLELHHKDGNYRNNELSNLCFLCPNCHSFTSTYRGKNKQ